MQRLLTRRPILAYVSCCYALTLLAWGGLLHWRGREPIDALFEHPGSILLIYLGAGAPVLAALTLSALAGGRAGLLHLMDRWRRWRAPLWVWIATLLPIALPMLLLVLVFLAGGPSGAPVWPGWGAVVPPASLLLILGGPLCEELGWRGYLQPRLLGRVRPWQTALLIGTIWCFWHVPLSFTPGTTPPLATASDWAIYWLGMVSSSALLIGLLSACRGSVPVAMAYHWAGNASDQIVRPLWPNADPQVWATLAPLELALRTILAVAMLACLARTAARP
ncbi:CPBP family intramembrane glutamic endopeptidase [Sandarakinorhabdus sp.]|uniref:CPBP family intramembrane glutamic endopeptidase n=1 Tax=Sandarakinorhabdus sp. TaxID=1916663 RepID=UPI0033429C8A